MKRSPTLSLAACAAALVAALSTEALANGTTPASPAANGSIALLGGGSKQLLVLNPNGSGLHAIANCPAGIPHCAIHGPAWSPDGTQLAFIRGRVPSGGHVGLMSVYVAAADGRDLRRLASCGYCVGGQLSWSPDGKWIVFSRSDAPPGTRPNGESLWVVTAAGGRPRRVTDCRAQCLDGAPSWSPNGNLIAFQRSPDVPITTAVWLYTVRPDGSDLHKIASQGVSQEWSPNGRQIAFATSAAPGRPRLEIANADGSDAHVLATGAPETDIPPPSWSPDGHKLVFTTPIWPQSKRYRAEVWTINADGSDKKLLYRSNGASHANIGASIWSPDGQTIAFSESPGGTFVINPDGTGLERISRVSSSELSWQALP
jgi:Tol biopolymer transport system component